MQIDKRLFHLIKIRLKGAMRGAEILPYGESVYIFNSATEDWYIIFDSNGRMRFNSKFFDTTFALFSMIQPEYKKVLKELIQEVFNFPITSCQRVGSNLNWEIKDALSKNKKNWSISTRYNFPFQLVKKYLEFKKNEKDGKWYFVDLI